MEIKSWEKIGDPEVIAKSYGRSLFMQRYRDPYTQEIKEYTQFKGTDFACIVMAVTVEREVLVTRQYRHAPDKILLELPGGNPKYKGQPPISVAREEVAEETMGYEPEEIIYLMSEENKKYWLDPASFVTPHYPFLFLGCRKTNTEAKLDKGEYVELVKMPLEEWIYMCLHGQIPDAKSLVVTLLSLRYLVPYLHLNLAQLTHLEPF